MTKRADWEVPQNPDAAVKKWGKSGTVSIDIAKVAEELGVLITLDTPEERQAGVRGRRSGVPIARVQSDPWGMTPEEMEAATDYNIPDTLYEVMFGRPRPQYGGTRTGRTSFGAPNETTVAVRLSGHPDALLAMFRALHIEYAKRHKQRRRKKVMKRTIIFDEGEGDA